MVSQSSFAGTGVGARSRIGFLTRPNEGRFVVQDFARFPESLEWKLGQAYLSACGTKGFVQDKTPIPFAINNDGALSRNAADVFFESLLVADEAGSLDPEIFVLELGIGLGLFAVKFAIDSGISLLILHRPWSPFKMSKAAKVRPWLLGPYAKAGWIPMIF